MEMTLSPAPLLSDDVRDQPDPPAPVVPTAGAVAAGAPVAASPAAVPPSAPKTAAAPAQKPFMMPKLDLSRAQGTFAAALHVDFANRGINQAPANLQQPGLGGNLNQVLQAVNSTQR
jgi:hypothetical protein